MTEAVTAVGTSVLVFVPFGQLVMSYRHLRLLNRSTNDTRRSCNGRRYERACEEFHGWAGKLRWALGGAGVSRAREVLRQLVGEAMPKPHAERPTRRAVAPHDVLDMDPPYEDARSTTALRLIDLALRRGHSVNVFAYA